MAVHIRSTTSLELFRRLNIVFYSFMGSMFLFLIVALIVRNPERILDTPQESILTEYILVILIILGISGAYFIYIAGTRRVTEQSPLTDKVKYFYTFSIVKLSLFEFAGICGLIGYIVTAFPLYLAIGFVIIMLMLLHKPTPRRLVVEFKLTKKERDIVQSGQTFG